MPLTLLPLLLEPLLLEPLLLADGFFGSTGFISLNLSLEPNLTPTALRALDTCNVYGAAVHRKQPEL